MAPTPRFAVFDIDGTLIRWQLYHALFDALAAEALVDSQTYQHIREARRRWKQRVHAESYKEYELSIVKAYEALLANLSFEQFEAAIIAVFEEYKDQAYTYTRELIKDLKQQGYLLFAISGSPREIIGRIAEYYGFDDFTGSTFVRQGKHFTGKELPTVHTKGKLLQDMVMKHGVGFKNSIGVGDGFSDIGLLELVETPIAFNPEQRLFATAREHGWKIVIERKNVVYKLEPRHGSYQLS